MFSFVMWRRGRVGAGGLGFAFGQIGGRVPPARTDLTGLALDLALVGRGSRLRLRSCDERPPPAGIAPRPAAWGSTLMRPPPNRSRAVKALTIYRISNFRTTISRKSALFPLKSFNCTLLHISPNSNRPQNPVFQGQTPRKRPQTTPKTTQNPISSFRTTHIFPAHHFASQK